MNYADSTDYTNYLCGKTAVITTAFDYYAMLATAEIRRYTGRNVDEGNIPDCVKNCCCELAERLYRADTTAEQSDGKSSESVGGWSVSYESREQAQAALCRDTESCVYKWLSGTGLLFTGVR